MRCYLLAARRDGDRRVGIAADKHCHPCLQRRGVRYRRDRQRARQKGALFELIVVDDGSTDATPAILARYRGAQRYNQMALSAP